ncbi:MAG: antibiotic biosynthesis monooxygenase [Planctomycetota bacterium]|nr:MAG: antibiotic biosynthesis monooxygenase [Planctomycetota bacterium]
MFIVMNRFQVTPGREQDFMDAFMGRARAIDSVPGFLGLDMLKPKGAGAFISMTRWASEEDFVAWTKSDAFKQGHARRHPGMFQGPPVLEQYQVFDSTFEKGA